MLENIRLSFQGIWSHKMRSFLTMLGIIIGIAAIISIVSTIKGTNEQIKENLIGSGNNTVEVKISDGDNEYYTEYSGVPAGVPLISQAVVDTIAAYDEVESVSLYVSRWADNVFYKNIQLSGGKITGVDSSYFDTCGYVMKTGRCFLAEDYETYRKVAIIDESAASALFQQENPLGQTIEIGSEPFIIVGVVGKSEGFEPIINSLNDYYTYMSNSSGLVFIPFDSWPVVYTYDEPQNVIVKATTTENMSVAGSKTQKLLNESVTNENNIKYKAADLLEQAKKMQELSEATNQQLIWIASISLLVGGIGVMNIMLVSVTERTREIGLKKAVGARRGRILIQFLTEASVLTSMGGIIGVFAGIGLSEAISRMTSTRVAISIPAILISVVFSMLIGIIFGLLPSVKAANLNPIDALRHE